MSEKTYQNLIGVGMIILSVITMLLTKDGTISLFLIPMGLFLVGTKDIVIVHAQTHDEYEEDEEDDEDYED